MKSFKKTWAFLKSFSLQLALAVLLTAALTLTGCSEGKGSSPQGSSAQPPSLQSQEQGQAGEAPENALPSDTQVHFIDVGPVSYTHLDVYKRQFQYNLHSFHQMPQEPGNCAESAS